jgi:nicotinate-nucleotide pyrophosphorylase (carboxylating)
MDLDLSLMRDAIARFVNEDVGRGDATTTAVVPVEARGTARIEARGDFVVAGLEIAAACFDYVGPGTVRWTRLLSDGSDARAGEVLARLDGSLHTILIGERTALNLLGRLSGVATLTRSFVAAIEGTPARIVDTRKTTPGLRLLEKYAVRAGGGHNHRFGLDDGILIKDNHVRAAGGVSEAVTRARNAAPHGLVIEVEVTELGELDEALAAGADAVLLDNMTPEMVQEAVTRAGGKVLLEASGGVTLHNVRSHAEAGVDLISVGALTHSAPTADVSLEVED